MKSLNRRVREANYSRADVIIGKKGVTPQVIEEIINRLKRKNIIKVKLLKTAASTATERRRTALEVAQLARARLMSVRGRTFILYKERQDLLLRSRRSTRSRMRRC